MSKEKISISEIVDLMAVKHNFSRKQTEEFVRMLLSTVEDVLIDGEAVKIKDFGTFKPQWNEPRKSVDVNTGEEIMIPGFYKVVFTPDNDLKEQINRPYAHLEPVEQSISTDTAVENKTEETESPLRMFEEQATEIKNILSEINAMSVKKEPESEEEVSENEIAENEIADELADETEDKLDDNETVTETVEKNFTTETEEKSQEKEEDKEPIEIEEEEEEEGEKEEISTTNEENPTEVPVISEENFIAEKSEEKETNEGEDNQQFIYHTLTRMETRKQRKKRQKEERIERKRREIAQYFTENDFNIVREVKNCDKTSFPQEFSNEVISEDESPVVSVSAVPAVKSAAIIVPVNPPAEEIHQAPPEPAEETVSHRRKPIPMPSAEGLVSEHKEPIPMPESTEMPLGKEAEATASVENIVSEPENTEVVPLEILSEAPAETKQEENDFISEPAESAFITQETKTSDDIQKEIQRNKILEEKEDESVDYTFNPVEKSSKSWLWIVLVVGLLILATLIFWQWGNIVKLKNNLLAPKTEQVQDSTVNVVAKDTTIVKAETDTVVQPVQQAHNSNDGNIFDKPQTYNRFLATEEIKPGKSLSYFAKQYLNSPEFWVYIYEANKEIIKDPNNVPVGIKVKIPEVDARLINVNNPQAITYARSLGAIYLR